MTPTIRYNPADIAQAFAKMACLYPNRIMLGVGIDEALNEITTGFDGEWPEFKERFDRLREAVSLMGELWFRDRFDFEGHYYRTKGTSIYEIHEGGVPVYVAAGGRVKKEDTQSSNRSGGGRPVWMREPADVTGTASRVLREYEE